MVHPVTEEKGWPSRSALPVPPAVNCGAAGALQCGRDARLLRALLGADGFRVTLVGDADVGYESLAREVRPAPGKSEGAENIAPRETQPSLKAIITRRRSCTPVQSLSSLCVHSLSSARAFKHTLGIEK